MAAAADRGARGRQGGLRGGRRGARAAASTRSTPTRPPASGPTATSSSGRSRSATTTSASSARRSTRPRSRAGSTSPTTTSRRRRPPSTRVPGAPRKIIPKGSPYLVVYPFVKVRPWYMLPEDDRQRAMDEHMRIGHEFATIHNHTTYSFGIDDQEFMTVFECDEPADFMHLMLTLRESEASQVHRAGHPDLRRADDGHPCRPRSPRRRRGSRAGLTRAFAAARRAFAARSSRARLVLIAAARHHPSEAPVHDRA